MLKISQAPAPCTYPNGQGSTSARRGGALCAGIGPNVCFSLLAVASNMAGRAEIEGQVVAAWNRDWDLGDITAEGADPSALRTKILGRLRRAARADYAVWLTVHGVDDGLYYSPLLSEGDSQASRMWRDVAGQPAAEPIRQGVRNPRAEERRGFVSLAERARWAGCDDPADYSACRKFYLPHGVGDEARMLVFAGRRFVGWIGVFRWQDRAGFEQGDLRAINRSVDWVKCGLTAADCLQSACADPRSVYLVVTPAGRIAHASEHAADWLTQQRRADLGDYVRQVHRGEADPIVVFEGMEVRLSRMDGHGGRLHYMVHLIPAAVPTAAPTSLLTPAQRVVAEYAVAGATVDEMARALKRSRSTIKYHLKNIYETFGIGSRVELATVLSEP